MRDSKGVVLVAEDDPDQCDLLSELLGQEGYTVLVAHNSLQLMQQLLRMPDVLLLDLIGVSSPAAFRAIEALTPRPVVVLVSADDRLPAFAEQVGAEAYLKKPYDAGELLALVHAASNAARIARGTLEVAFGA